MLAADEEPEDPWKNKSTILAGNKADIPGALDQFQVLQETFGDRFPVLMMSAEENVGLDELGEEVFRALKVIRVYTKSPREKIDAFERTDPVVLSVGSTVADAASQIHRELGRDLKYAVLWGESGKFEGQRVGRQHKLIDGDIVELHG